MTEYYPDFFNDVFGPVMQPGSSSHTAGPCRLGMLANNLLGEDLKSIKIELDKYGSFAGTFGLMSEDLGMLSGAYGNAPDDERMFDIKDILTSQGIAYRFDYVSFPEPKHPNAVKFILTGKSGKTVYLYGNSTGGGMVETVDINGVACRFVGDGYLYCLEKVPESTDDIIVKSCPGVNGGEAVIVLSSYDISAELSKYGIIFRLLPVLPVHNVTDRKPQLFNTFTDWTAYAEKNGKSQFEAAIDYEINASGLSRDEIIDRMKTLRNYMRAQTDNIYKSEENIFENPYTGYHFRSWREYEKGRVLAGDVIALAIHYAFGVQAQTKGIKLVPGPMGTGGGYLYSAVRAVSETYNFSEEKEIEGLTVAAAVGALAYTRTNPTGEITGCTGECGVCGAMAAAAITTMAGGNPAQVEAAASLMLQAAIGWPCDPIPGGLNQPCISRVMTAVTMSIVFSDLALSGKPALLPFHEVLDVADKMGKMMPASLKCTSCGGTCTAPTAKKCKAEYEDWYKNN